MKTHAQLVIIGAGIVGASAAYALAQKGWIIPAFSMPPDAQSVNAMRMNVKETFSRDMADILVDDMRKAMKGLTVEERNQRCEEVIAKGLQQGLRGAAE